VHDGHARGHSGRDSVLVIGLAEQRVEVVLGGGSACLARGLRLPEPAQVVAGGRVGVEEVRLRGAVSPREDVQGLAAAVITDQDVRSRIVRVLADAALELRSRIALAGSVVAEGAACRCSQRRTAGRRSGPSRRGWARPARSASPLPSPWLPRAADQRLSNEGWEVRVSFCGGSGEALATGPGSAGVAVAAAAPGADAPSSGTAAKEPLDSARDTPSATGPAQIPMAARDVASRRRPRRTMAKDPPAALELSQTGLSIL
jgi:hypothetical protein